MWQPPSRPPPPRAPSRAGKAAAPLIAAALVLIGPGCASKAYVRRQMDPDAGTERSRLTELRGRLDESSARLDELDDEAAENRARLEEASKSARLALERSDEIEQRVTAPGEVVFRHDSIPFAAGSAELRREARDLLDGFATQLLARRQPVQIEIRGHSDPAEPGGRTLRLGSRRAREVERYLHIVHGIPLHRMHTLSLGPGRTEGAEVEPDHDRRVSLVVVS